MAAAPEPEPAEPPRVPLVAADPALVGVSVGAGAGLGVVPGAAKRLACTAYAMSVGASRDAAPACA
ncbi:hypothetical protein QFZ62_002134 [Clavibacter sp. B3I6]|uniref:hypothetical protein n=1 Tax=Clavibacter sp. B3I6 TaxID=3042268 RepID=UPI0027852950|nr:hypothetical protein [Clavibacter sp. B3I6]MDQ0744826.1 hypothetical protein [Clavibacter sp. B3I6]